MASIGRWLARLVGGMALLLMAALIYLTQMLDPNDYRADIEQLATDQGISLSLKGNLSWTFWPRLGISIEHISVGAPSDPLLEAKQVSAALAIALLLKQQIVIESIALDGVAINLVRDSQGRGNWEELQSDSKGIPAPINEPSASVNSPIAAADRDGQTASAMLLQVASVSLSNLSLHFEDERSGSEIKLSDMSLLLNDFNLVGKPFHWQHSSQLDLPDRPQLGVDTRGRAVWDFGAQQLQLLDSSATLLANQAALELTLQGQVDLDTSRVDLQAAIAPFNLQQWLTQWRVSLPSMSAADALSKVGGSARLSGDASLWQLQDLSLVLDHSQLLGHGSVSDSGAVELVLNADRLDLDRYLPMEPPVAAEASQATGSSVPASTTSRPSTRPVANKHAQRVVPKLSAEPFKLDGLRELKANVSLGVASLTAQTLTLEDVVLKLTAESGLVQLKRLLAKQGKGVLELTGQLDTRREAPRLQLATDFNDIDLNPILTTLAGEPRVSGTLTGQLNLTAQGASLRAWQQQLRGQLKLSTQALTIAEMDIERSACELAALVNRKPAPTLNWKGQTQFEQLTAQIQLQGEVLRFQSASAEVENLRVKAKGSLDLRDGRFDVPMDVAFVGQADAERDCQVRDRWRNRDLPLRCDDRLATVSASSCGPDLDRLNDLLSDEVKVQASDKLKEKLQDKLGKENGEAVEQLLRGLFKRRD